MEQKVIYLSGLLGKKIFDSSGRLVGRLADLALLNHYASGVTDLIVKPNGKKIVVPLSQIKDITAKRLKLTGVLADHELKELAGREILLVKNVLDQQVVDINGHKVVRANDVALQVGPEKKTLRVIGVEVGTAGILRRLGLGGLLQAVPRTGAILGQKLLPWELIEPLEGGELRVKIAHQKLGQLHPADLADIIEKVGSEERVAILKDLNRGKAADAIQEIAPEIQAAIIKKVPKERAAEMIGEMDPDKAADLLSNLQRNFALELLDKLPKKKATELKNLLAYEENTAGALMTSMFVQVNKNMNTSNVLAMLREQYENAPSFYYVYVTDDKERLVGVFDLRKLISTPFDIPIEKIMSRQLNTIGPKVHKKRIAQLLTKYNLLAMPVVDKSRRILGVVKIDDILEEFFPTE
jgi:sporulation protein YlmC with PRC-barrel domain